ncbi:RNA 2',3'-cyclic phosphodiesterase, partial [Patescibacteria group bacterium]|nr:RNA 2',3'-cyclic phosphodiesterase [Patescibacteria group bacterium]
KWTKSENLHITLEFLGYLDDQALTGVKQIIKDVAAGHNLFSLALTEICYGPPKTLPPRMVWAIGKESREFVLLCDNLKKELAKLLKIQKKSGNKENIPHITLARIKEWEWRYIEPEERPEIERIIDFKLPVESIDLMESVLRKSGPEYKILESFNLNK